MRGIIKGVSVSPNAPKISHLLFADDTMLFCQASAEAALEISSLLHRYSLASGQEINIDKSTVIFSRNVYREKIDEVRGYLNVRVVDKHEKYLGLPIEMGRSKREVFSWLRDRVWSKIDGYGTKFLSKAGKEVLIKSVIQAIPTYVMGCFKLPDYLLKEIESMISRFWWGNGQDRSIHWVSWLNLCRSKRDGGLGFRDLRYFNKAMLGKQIWRVIQNPDSLLSRVLKAKYFPNSDILEASPKGNASFTWRSICSAIDLVKKGVRWRIGDGSLVDIWKDPWIPRDSGFRPFTPNVYNLRGMKVASIIDPALGCWNESVVRELLWEEDSQVIFQIPITTRNVPDIRVWHFHKMGWYTIKTAYYLAIDTKLQEIENQGGQSSTVAQTNWKWIWGLNLPNKIKIFCWRMIKSSLPILVNLQKRGVNIPIDCPLCHESVESTLHVFKMCQYARVFWAVSMIPNRVINAESGSILDWINGARHNLSKGEFELFVCGCWSLWSNRNKKVHDEKTRDPSESILFVQDYVTRFQSARLQFAQPYTPDQTTSAWSPPPIGKLKVNFDVSISHNPPGACLGVVARDHTGQIIAWEQKRVAHVCCPEIGEGLAARLGAILASRLQVSEVELEGDCLTIIKLLNQHGSSRAAAGGIIEDVHQIATNFTSVSFLFVKRCNNQLAHCLARTCLLDAHGTSVLPSHCIGVV